MGDITPTYLRCEYLIDPLGIDVLKPRLSWVLESNLRNQTQSGYQILVASNLDLINADKGDLWDTGKVNSDQTNQIEYDGTPLKSKMFCFWKVRAWDKKDQPSDWSSTAFWSMGFLNQSDWKAKWIGSPTKRNLFIKKILPKIRRDPSPLLRKKFSIDGKIKRAMVYISALGHYELYINGIKIGNHILAPEWTDYHKRVQYQTFEVTDTLQEGDNVISTMLADGWYRGYTGPTGYFNDVYGVNRRLILQLSIEKSDESIEEIVSDGSWKIFKDGPIRKSDHFKGEIYDARKEQDGWNQVDYDDSTWKKVTVDDTVKANLVTQMNQPIKIIKKIKPVAVMEPKRGKFIYNLGQNIAGFCKIKLSGKVCNINAKIKLRHGEMLDSKGRLYTKNLRGASPIDIFITKDNEEREYYPRFTYHGFQYVEVSGLKSGIMPDLDMITGYAIASSSPLVGLFECSHPKVNKLWSNILWTQWDNLISVPTDCPQRDERCGWMGDAQVFSQTSMYNLDMAAFYTKWIQDIRDAQTKEGAYPDIVPYTLKFLGGFIAYVHLVNSPAWADCGVILPWIMYLNYGDIRILESHYESAKRFIDFVHSKNPTLIWVNEVSLNYGDWLNGDTFRTQNVDYPEKGAEMPKDAFATAYFAYSTGLLSKMAKILKLEDDSKFYDLLSKKIINNFNQKFVSQDGKIKGDTQAGYALALQFDLLPEGLQRQAFVNLLKALEKYDGRISTGFCSTLPLMLQLTRWGRNDIAYSLLLSHRFPSWFYMIDQGATTMWERWDGYVKGRGFQSKWMNSFCHYSIGAVGEWIYKVILGINLDEKQPGFKHVIIKPQPEGDITWAKGYHDSIYGRISIDWKLANDFFQLKVNIPSNTSATIYLAALSLDDIEGTIDIRNKKFEKNLAILEVGSGIYHFKSKIK